MGIQIPIHGGMTILHYGCGCYLYIYIYIYVHIRVYIFFFNIGRYEATFEHGTYEKETSDAAVVHSVSPNKLFLEHRGQAIGESPRKSVN